MTELTTPPDILCQMIDRMRAVADRNAAAGDLAAADLSRPGLIASDLPWYIAKAFADPAFPPA